MGVVVLLIIFIFFFKHCRIKFLNGNELYYLKVIKNTFPTQAFYSEFYHYLQATDQSIP